VLVVNGLAMNFKTLFERGEIRLSNLNKTKMLDVDLITDTKKVMVDKMNYWLIKLMYGDAAEDSTASFQIPANIEFNGEPT